MKLLTEITPWTYEDRQTCQEIFSGLFLGPQSCSKDGQLVDRHGISDIVLVRSSSGVETAMLRPRLTGVTHHVIEMDDNSVVSSQRVFSSFVRLLAEVLVAAPGRRVLVVGASGMNRSAALVAAALIAGHGMSAEDAAEYLVGRRRCVCLSPALRRQLKEFELTVSTPATETSQPGCRPKRGRDSSDVG